MRRGILLILGLVAIGVGAHMLLESKPGEGDYRYPRSARSEAKRFSRTIKDAKERERFLKDTTGRVEIEYPKKVFFGSSLCVIGISCTLSAVAGVVRRSRQKKRLQSAGDSSKKAA